MRRFRPQDALLPLLVRGGLVGGLMLVTWSSGAGCQNVECGPGTWEVDGRCVPVSGIAGDGGIDCGPHAVWQGDRCVPLPHDFCGPYTKPKPELDAEGNPTGYFICVGDPPTQGEPPPECPEETGPSGEICINGYIRQLVDEAEGVYLVNRMSAPEGIPLRLVVKIHDPLIYAQDPNNAVPLGVATVDASHATFRVLDVAVPGTDIIALVVDDEDNAARDEVVMTGVPYRASRGRHLTDVSGFAISRSQEQRWSEAIGGDLALQDMGCPANPGGGDRTLASCGTWVGVFLEKEPEDLAVEAPLLVEGVQPYGPGGPLPAARTFYPGLDEEGRLLFDDPTPGVVWSDEDGPQEHTGILGTVFYPLASLGNMTGECRPSTPCADSGCIFFEVLGGSVPGAMFVQFMLPVTCGR